MFVRIVLSILAFFGPGYAFALNIQCLGADTSSPRVAFGPSHLVLLEGEIEAGDFQKVKIELNRIKSHDPSCRPASGYSSPEYFGLFAVVLNSPGGNLVEALDISNFILDQGISTRVDAGGECLSACALIFMSGMQHVGDGEVMPSRTMQLGATIGFHSPFLGQIDLSNVPLDAQAQIAQNAFETAIAASSRLVALAVKARWKAGFVNVLLRTPHDRFTYVDTIGKIGDWGIKLSGLNIPVDISDVGLRRLCINEDFWKDDDAGVAIDFSAPIDPNTPWPPTRADFDAMMQNKDIHITRTDEAGYEKVMFTVEMGGFYCEYSILEGRDGPQISSRKQPIDPIHTIPAYVRLADVGAWLAGRGTAGSRGDHSPFDSFAGRVWDHNGSLMRSQVNGDSISIIYDRPRQGLSTAEVRPGTELFRGRLEGGRITGMANLFSSEGCPRLTYKVSGEVGEIGTGTLYLRGPVPVRDGCNVVGVKSTGGNANLKFDLRQ